ncbi:MAG: hypothetical protein EOO11_19150 [Chitinophagaceae bacterium]|nr:MAG: hypothetical protein EOO11_19150 [Chitinophagaceae bacterium]
MKSFFLFFLMLLAAGATAQRGTGPDLGDSREAVREKLQRYLDKHKRTGTLIDTDTSLLLRAPMKSDTVLFSYGFNPGGRLASFGYSGCRECVQKFLSELLANKRFGWRRLNDSVYYANYGKRQVVEITDAGGQLSFKRSIVSLTKAEYAALWPEGQR